MALKTTTRSPATSAGTIQPGNDADTGADTGAGAEAGAEADAKAGIG